MNNILDYLIIALVFAVVIALLLQLLGGCGEQENMGNTQETLPSCNVDDNQNAVDLFSFMNRNNDPAISKAMPTYIKEIAMGGRFQKSQETQPYTPDDIQAYQNDFFGFQSTVNRMSSTDMIDTVDKINQISTNSGNELDKFRGKNVADVYDSLTQNKFFCDQNHKMLPPPVVDTIQNVGTYFEGSNDDKTYSAYNWQYENDTVSNGGNFYDAVKAYDSGFEANMMVNL